MLTLNLNFIKTSLNANTMKTQTVHIIKYHFKGSMRPLLLYGEVVGFFKTFRLFYQITVLADAHRDIFYPCFVVAVINVIGKLL